MCKKIFHFIGGCLSLIIIGLLLVIQGPAMAADAKLVKIQPVGEGELVGFYLDPPNLTIKKNSIVVWLSAVQEEDVQVIFMEGKTCQDVTANSKKFSMDKKRGCYVTTFMSFAETSSLQFVESGAFKYYVATTTGKIKTKGTIVVP